MLRKLLAHPISAFERRYDYDMDYAHRMLRASRGAFLRFAVFSHLSQARDGVPLGAWFAARIVTAMSEDCGPCAQLVVKMAEEAGVAAPTLRAIVAGDVDALDSDTALGVRFARAVVTYSSECAALHELAVQRFGERGVVSLALAIANTRMYPTLKRALGDAHACQRIEIGGQSITPGHLPGRGWT
jgi:hypothetical protein